MSASGFLTDLGKAELEDVKHYPSLDKYYDSMVGNICIPLSDFLNTPSVRFEAFSLLGSKNLVTFDACWVMTQGLIGDEDGELIPGVIITAVVDLLS